MDMRRRRGGRGDLRPVVLLLLSEKPMHGYQLMQEIEERSHGFWRPSPGSVYPSLQLLEDEGLVEADRAEGRRVFCLTDAGRAYIEQRAEELAAARESLIAHGDAGEHAMHAELRELMEGVRTALRQVAHAGTPEHMAAARELLIETRRGLYRILADEGKE